MMYVPLRDMLIIHFLIGAGFVIWRSVVAANRNNDPPRTVFNFGDGVLGDHKRWLQWYSWSLLFEFITSIFYIHSGLLYYELGMSFIEAGALVVGAFVVDRLVDLFLGQVDLNLPKPKLDLGKPLGAAKDGIKSTATAAKAAYTDYIDKVKAASTAEQQRKQATEKDRLDKFNDLIKGQ